MPSFYLREPSFTSCRSASTFTLKLWRQNNIPQLPTINCPASQCPSGTITHRPRHCPLLHRHTSRSRDTAPVSSPIWPRQNWLDPSFSSSLFSIYNQNPQMSTIPLSNALLRTRDTGTRPPISTHPTSFNPTSQPRHLLVCSTTPAATHAALEHTRLEGLPRSSIKQRVHLWGAVTVIFNPDLTWE